MPIPALPFASLIDNLETVLHDTGFDLQQFIAQCIAFTVLSVVLWIYAWKPVRAMLELRQQKIADAMANAEQIKKELADAEASRLKVIQKANEQANALIAEAEKTAAVRGEQKIQEATRQAEEIVKRAHEATVLERDRLLAELKRDISALVIQTTEKIAGRVLTAEDQARLNAETQRQLSAPQN
jgi:F-type H+-transporting ATPase subunit b